MFSISYVTAESAGTPHCGLVPTYL